MLTLLTKEMTMNFGSTTATPSTPPPATSTPLESPRSKIGSPKAEPVKNTPRLSISSTFASRIAQLKHKLSPGSGSQIGHSDKAMSGRISPISKGGSQIAGHSHAYETFSSEEDEKDVVVKKGSQISSRQGKKSHGYKAFYTKKEEEEFIAEKRSQISSKGLGGTLENYMFESSEEKKGTFGFWEINTQTSSRGGEVEVVRPAEDWMTPIVEDRETDDEHSLSFKHDSAEGSEAEVGPSSLREPNADKVKKNRIVLGSHDELSSDESSTSEESLSEVDDELFHSVDMGTGKEKDFEELYSAETVPDFSEPFEVLKRPNWDRSEIRMRECLTPKNAQKTNQEAKNAILEEDLVLYDAATLNVKILDYLKVHAEEILRKKKWGNIPAKQLERMASPRSLNLYKKIHRSRSILRHIINNLIVIEKCLYDFVERTKANTKWMKNFRKQLDVLIKSNFKSFVDYFENSLSIEDKKLVLLALGNDAAANLEVLKMWVNRSNQDMVKKYLLDRELFYLGVENLREKKMDVSQDIFSDSNVFCISRSDIVRGLTAKKVWDIPHFVNGQQVICHLENERDESKLENFLNKILNASDNRPLEETAFAGYVEDFLRFNLTDFDYLYRLLYLGHYRMALAIHFIFNSNAKSADIKTKMCKVQFNNCKNFELQFQICCTLEDKAKVTFTLDIRPSKKTVNSFKAILKVLHYEFNPKILDYKKNEILEHLVNYSNAIRSHKTLPRGMSYYTSPGSKNLDREFKNKLEQEITNCNSEHPYLGVFKLKDGYRKECRGAIVKNRGIFSNELIEELQQKLIVNEAFFESIIPRISYLAKELQNYSERKNRQSIFYEEIMKIFKNINEASEYIVRSSGITNNTNVERFLEIFNEITDSEICDWFLKAIGGTAENGKKLIDFLKKTVNPKKITKQIEKMAEEYHKYSHEMFSSKCYHVTIPKKLQKAFFTVFPEDIFRSYKPQESSGCIFNSIRINEHLLFNSEDDFNLSLFLKKIYAHFEEERQEERTDFETEAFEKILNTSWKEILPYFFYKKKGVEGDFHKRKEIDLKKLRKIFDFPAINLKKIQDDFSAFKKKKKYAADDLCKIIATWFIAATVPCYPILVLGANGVWSIVETLLQSTFTGFNKLPFGLKVLPGIDLAVQIESPICYKVKVTKSLGVCPRVDRWNPALSAVDNKSPVATMLVESTFCVIRNSLEALIEIKPPIFHKENIYSAEDPYRIIKVFDRAILLHPLVYGIHSESKKGRKAWNLKVKDSSDDKVGDSSNSFAAINESRENLENESTST